MPIMNHSSFFRAFTAVGACLLFSSCIRREEMVSLEALPSPWVEAIQHPRKTDVSGTYQNLGKYSYKGASVPNIFPQGLAALFFPEKKPAVQAQQVRLLQQGRVRLSVEAIQNGQVVAQKTIEIQREAADGSVVLHQMNVFGGGGKLASAGRASINLSLFNGGDGRLYLHANGSSIGVIGIIVPFQFSTENWGRWESTP
jgi:hypothetical protein